MYERSGAMSRAPEPSASPTGSSRCCVFGRVDDPKHCVAKRSSVSICEHSGCCREREAVRQGQVATSRVYITNISLNHWVSELVTG